MVLEQISVIKKIRPIHGKMTSSGSEKNGSHIILFVCNVAKQGSNSGKVKILILTIYLPVSNLQ